MSIPHQSPVSAGAKQLRLGALSRYRLVRSTRKITAARSPPCAAGNARRQCPRRRLHPLLRLRACLKEDLHDRACLIRGSPILPMVRFALPGTRRTMSPGTPDGVPEGISSSPGGLAQLAGLRVAGSVRGTATVAAALVEQRRRVVREWRRVVTLAQVRIDAVPQHVRR